MYLYQHFPKAKWFCIVDDDTFLIPQNIKTYVLPSYNEQEPHYIGRGMDGWRDVVVVPVVVCVCVYVS